MASAEIERMVAQELRKRGKPYSGQEFVKAVEFVLWMFD